MDRSPLRARGLLRPPPPETPDGPQPTGLKAQTVLRPPPSGTEDASPLRPVVLRRRPPPEVLEGLVMSPLSGNGHFLRSPPPEEEPTTKVTDQEETVERSHPAVPRLSLPVQTHEGESEQHESQNGPSENDMEGNEEENEDDDEDDESEEGSGGSTASNKFSNEKKCQLCHTEEGVLRLHPCLHWSLCKPCLKTEEKQCGENDLVCCPVCLQSVEAAFTAEEEQAMEEEREQQEWEARKLERAHEHGAALTARATAVRSLGLDRDVYEKVGLFDLTEDEIGKVFGRGMKAFFQQVRVLAWIHFLWFVFALPVSFSYILALQSAQSKKEASNLDSVGDSINFWLEFTSMPKCSRSACNLFLDYFLMVDNVFLLIAAALVAVSLHNPSRMWRKPVLHTRDTFHSARTLLLIQTPHLGDPVKKEALETFFLQEQMRNVEAKHKLENSYGRRARFVREKTPPIVDVRIEKLVNCSSFSLRFADQAEKRYQLQQEIADLEQRLEGVYSITKQYREIRDKIEEKQEELEEIDEDYFDDLFFEEELGSFDRHTPSIDFILVTFRNEDQAAFARQLLHYDRDGTFIHHWKLLFGAPATPLRAIGGKHDIFPANINWKSLQDPHRYAQSSWPGVAACIVFALTCTLNLMGYLAFSACMQRNSFALAAFVLVVWQKTTQEVTFKVLDWYGAVFYSSELFWSVLAGFCLVYLPSTYGWIFVWDSENLLTRSWWRRGNSALLVSVELIYLTQSVFMWFYGNRLYLWARKFVHGNPQSEFLLKKKFEPPVWQLRSAYLAVGRTALVCIAFSGVLPVLLLIGGVHLAVLYVSQKQFFLNECRKPKAKLVAVCTADGLATLLDLSLIVRVIVSLFSMLTLVPESAFLHVPVINHPLALLVVYVVGGIFIFALALRMPWFYNRVTRCLTLGDRLCFSYRYHRLRRKRDKERAICKNHDTRCAELFSLGTFYQLMDITQHFKYRELFDEVTCVDDLDSWSPIDELEKDQTLEKVWVEIENVKGDDPTRVENEGDHMHVESEEQQKQPQQLDEEEEEGEEEEIGKEEA